MSTMSLSTAALPRLARWLAVGAGAALLLSLLPAAVLAAPPVGTQLAFSAQPAGGVTYGSVLSAQPKVEIRDAGGNLVTSGPDATAAVTLSISPGTPTIGGPGALACSATTVNAVAGVATFGGCRINTNSGAGYKLRAGATLSGGGVTKDSNSFSIHSLAPVKLVFSTQPGGGTGGVEWLNQPVLQVQDAFNQVAVQVNGTATVTLAIAASPGPGTLTCGASLSRTVVLGVATFTGCRIDKAGVGYRLRATSSLGFAFAVTSSPFTILAGPAAKLAFLRQPAGDVPYGSFLPVQPIVAIQDLGGNVVTTGADAGRAVYLSITPGTPTVGGPGAVACFASPVFAVGGVAAFSGCRINTNSGLGYKLRASAVLGGIAVVADSTPFDIYSMAPVKLAFTRQPGGGTGGTPWDQQPTVAVVDALNQIAVQDNTTFITLAIGANPAPGTLTCTSGTSRTVSRGVAAFAGCAIDKAAAGYTLTATSSRAYAWATSRAFTILVGPPVKIGFTAEPGGSVVNEPFAVQPAVAIQDAGGNTVVKAPPTGLLLVFGSNPTGAALICTTPKTQITVNGVASYSGCRIDYPGTGYRLAATGGGYAPAYSSRFDVSAQSTTISLTIDEPVISLGASVDLTIQFAARGAGRVVALQKKTALDAGWVSFASATMNASGRAVVEVTPEYTALYRAVFAGAADLGPAMSAVAEVAVRHRASLEPRSRTGLRVFTRPVRITYRGSVEPVTGGQTMTFQIYQKVRGAWVYRTAKSVIADDAGRATFSWTWTRGQWYIRVRANATVLNTWGYSNIEKVTVR